MNTAVENKVPHAKLVGGVWLPETERHFVEVMTTPGSKNHRTVDGKLTYQYFKLEAAMKNIPRERRRNAIDIGAHVGLWAMWLVREFAWVHCFEPMGLHCEILPHNMPTDNYMLYQNALGAAAGTGQMVLPDGVTGNAHFVPGKAGDYVISPLDDFEFTEVDFIKIDVEGFELQVVQGAKETLLRNKPFMVLEQKGNDEKLMGGKRNEALAWCQSIGMKPQYQLAGDWFLDWGNS